MKRVWWVGMVAAVVAGCGAPTVVSGTPVAAPRIPSIEKTGSAPPPPPASQLPSTTSGSTEETPSSVDAAPGGDPGTVVQAYFDAINSKDYKRAWELGGKNVGHPYDKFAAGFATTDHDVLTVVSVQGTTVTADLTAFETDGTQKKFHGTYIVTDGTITKFSVKAVG